MDKPIYVKIKAGIVMQRWYAKLVGATFPVVSEDETYYGLANGDYIVKEDCEVVPTLQPETEQVSVFLGNKGAQELERIATEYCNSTVNFLDGVNVAKAEKAAFKAGYRTAKSNEATAFDRGFKQAQKNLQVVPEGQHLISTELTDKNKHSLRAIATLLKDKNYPGHAQELEEIFPTVFVPAKTYKPGQRFICSEHNEPYMIATPKEFAACLISLTDGNRYCNPVKIADSESITQEEFDRLTNGKSERFTLLPDTTDQMV